MPITIKLDYYDRVDNRSVIINVKEITSDSEIGLFEQFEVLNNSLRYCNGCYYKFQDKTMEVKYFEWLKSDDYKKKSFKLYYGGGIVD